MAPDSVDTLLAVLRRAQLFAPEQLDELARELGPVYDDPRALAEHLVEIEWLTPYQLEALFEGDLDRLALGPYILLDRLGEGGVSEVFKAWDTARGRVVAVKVLRQHLRSQHDAERQFQRELGAMPRLNHPNVIRTLDASRLGAVHYFAMEFVEGMDLEKFVRAAGPLPVGQACDYIRQVAQGLQHAHQFGLVHRDIKPANLFLIHPPLPGTPQAAGPLRRGPEPLVKILDWGLARIRLPADVPCGADSVELEAEKGVLIGTADYVPPEQARDAGIVDTRGDIYSLGCTFVYLLTGRPPFPGTSLMQKLMQHQQAPPPSVRALRPEVPEELDAVIRRMMAKHPKDRYQIPLLVVAPLRKFSPSASPAPGLARPGAPTQPGNGPRPSLNTTALGTAGRNGTGSGPGVASNGTSPRPGVTQNGVAHRPGSNGTPPGGH